MWLDTSTGDGDWLAQQGFRRSDKRCPICGTGTLWYGSHELICANCSVVFDKEEDRSNATERNRTARTQSDGRQRCVGGHIEAYPDTITETEF